MLTGATGTLGRALLPKLLERGQAVRCLVRDPRRLGPMRVEVSISIGNIADRHVFGTALRGIDAVVHLASVTRDQNRAPIEELNALATRRLVTAAVRRDVGHVFAVSPLAASAHSPVRLFRSAALAEQAMRGAPLASTIFKASLIYAADDRYLGTMAAWSRALPVMPLFGGRDTEFEPIWAQDAAEAMVRAIVGESTVPDVSAVELMGPEVLTNEQFLHIALRRIGRRRPLVPVPDRCARLAFAIAQRKLGQAALATPDELDLLSVHERSQRGIADVEALGVEPLTVDQALSA